MQISGIRTDKIALNSDNKSVEGKMFLRIKQKIKNVLTNNSKWNIMNLQQREENITSIKIQLNILSCKRNKYEYTCRQ